MAAVDRRNLNLDDFVGLNWGSLAERVNVLPSEGSEAESKDGMGGSETMTLSKEDMHIFGRCPAQDDFSLVVCSHCGQVVKPQAFERHCERRHGSIIVKMFGHSPALTPSASKASACIERQKDGRCDEAVALSTAPLCGPKNKPAKDQKEIVSLSSVKFPETNPAVPQPSTSTPHPRVPPCHSAPLPPAACSSSSPPSEKASVQKPSAGAFTVTQCAQRGMRTYSRTFKNSNKKESEPSARCRVLDPEKKKLCSQELICSGDSVHQQSRPPSKPRTPDQLAAEQKITSAGRDVEQILVKSKIKDKYVEAVQQDKTTRGSKSNFSSNCHILRPRNPSESFLEEESSSTVEVELQPPYPFNQSLLSSEESEEDEEEEATDLPATPWHPKPLGLCTFGCRTLGCSIFTFDRRLHRLRFALSSMLDRHVNAHLWKKMPQVSSGVRSNCVTPLVKAAPARTSGRPSKPTGSLCLESTLVGQLETKSHPQNSHSTKQPYSSTSGSFGSGRRRALAVRPGAKLLGEVEVELKTDVSATQRAGKPLQPGREDKSSKYIRDPPLHEKSQPHVSFSSEDAALSHGTKPRRPFHAGPAKLEKCSSSPPRSRGRTKAAQQKVVNFDERGFTQKRKGGNESMTLSPSLSRNSKYKCLSSSSSRSSLVSWKGETIEDVLVWGLDKRSDP